MDGWTLSHRWPWHCQDSNSEYPVVIRLVAWFLCRLGHLLAQEVCLFLNWLLRTSKACMESLTHFTLSNEVCSLLDRGVIEKVDPAVPNKWFFSTFSTIILAVSVQCYGSGRVELAPKDPPFCVLQITGLVQAVQLQDAFIAVALFSLPQNTDERTGISIPAIQLFPSSMSVFVRCLLISLCHLMTMDVRAMLHQVFS